MMTNLALLKHKLALKRIIQRACNESFEERLNRDPSLGSKIKKVGNSLDIYGGKKKIWLKPTDPNEKLLVD